VGKVFEDHVLHVVDAYLHGVFDAGWSARIDEHCRECPICAVALEEARKRHTACEAMPAVEASEMLIRRTEMRIANRRRSWLHGGTLALVAAAAALVIGAFHVYYATLSPSPYDLRVLGQRELFAGTDASLRVVLWNRDTFEPVPDAPVEIELADSDRGQVVRLASFTTDALGSGSPRLRLPDWADGQYELRVRAAPRRSREMIARPVTLKRNWQVMLTSDRPVYQPGQTIHLRSLALRRPDLKPVAGQEVRFTIVDPNTNTIFSQKGAPAASASPRPIARWPTN
jgi:hypothetical protein